MNVKKAYEKIDNIRELKYKFGAYLKSIEDFETWSMLCSVDDLISEYIYHLRYTVENTEVDI